MDEILHLFKTMVEAVVLCYLQGNHSFQGFLRGYGSKSNHQGTASFRSMFPLARVPFRVAILTHSQVRTGFRTHPPGFLVAEPISSIHSMAIHRDE